MSINIRIKNTAALSLIFLFEKVLRKCGNNFYDAIVCMYVNIAILPW